MRICLPAILLLVVASPVRGHSQCQLTGVWELVSGKVDGQPYPTGLHQQKFITRSHWAWVLRQDTDLKDLKTVADTLAAYRTRAGGSGFHRRLHGLHGGVGAAHRGRDPGERPSG